MELFACLKGLHKTEWNKNVDYVLNLLNLSDIKNVKCRALSGGMVRRIGIAQAILGNPDVIIFDEPTTGLDPEERIRFQNIILQIKKHSCVIIATHLIEDVMEICDNVMVLAKGDILFLDKTERLAESLAETFAPSGYTSSLLFGLQWDLVLKHLETKGTNPGTSATSLQNAIKSNSTDWGNYNNANFDITNTDAMYSEDYGASWKKVSEEADKKYQKASNKEVLLTTGAEVRNSMLNICDLAGNVWEWTLEKTSDVSYPCALRGGSSSSNGSGSPASNRSGITAANSNLGLGARVSLY